MQTQQKLQKSNLSNQQATARKPAKLPDHASPFDHVLSLHGTLGNQAVQRLVESGAIQTKLTVGAPNDIYEQEADRVAEQVMRMPESGFAKAADVFPLLKIAPIQRMCPSCEDEVHRQEVDEDKIQQQKAEASIQRMCPECEEEVNRKEASSRTPEVTPSLESSIRSRRGGGQPLPAASREFFGPRIGADFSSVRVHNDTYSDHFNRSLNARAFTTGQDIFFRGGEYNPDSSSGQKLLAHELAHTVQQGKAPIIQTKNGESKPEALKVRSNLQLSRLNESKIQLATQTSAFGDFKDPTYNLLSRGVEIRLEFHPGNNVDAKKIGLVQSLKRTTHGKTMPIHPTQASRTVPDAESGGGYYVDQHAKYKNPLYATGASSATDTLETTPTSSSWGEHGYHYTDGTTPKNKEAWIEDTPKSAGAGIANSGQEFETTALAIKGAQEGTYYGSVKWGWTTDSKAKLSKIPFTLVSKGAPSQNFMAAAELWNSKTALGTIKTIASPTDVFDSNTMSKKFDIPRGTIVTVGSGHIENNVMHRRVTIPSKAGDNTGSIRVSDMRDQGDGAATIDLPINQMYIMNPGGNMIESGTGNRIQLPKGTRVIFKSWGPHLGNFVEVEVGDGPQTGKIGTIHNDYLYDERTNSHHPLGPGVNPDDSVVA